MTIHSISNKTPNLQTVKTPAKPDVDSKNPAVVNSEQEDTIAITAIAKEIHKTFESSSSSASSAVDSDRISAVKKALADGSYTVNAERLAEKLIQFEKLFSRNNSS